MNIQNYHKKELMTRQDTQVLFFFNFEVVLIEIKMKIKRKIKRKLKWKLLGVPKHYV